MRIILLPALCFLFAISFTSASDLRLEVGELPDGGLLVRKVDLGPWKRLTQRNFADLRACALFRDSHLVPCQIIPVPSRSPDDFSFEAIIVAKFDRNTVEQSRRESLAWDLSFFDTETDAQKPAPEFLVSPIEELITETSVYRMTQHAGKQGGLPCKIEFLKTGRVLETHRWFDRLHSPDRPGLNVASPNEVRLFVLDDGPLCRVVRQEVRFSGTENSGPEIDYTWFFFKDESGLIHVSADYFQAENVEWKERHFLELHVPDGSFSEYVDLAKPTEKTKFDGSKKTMSVHGAAILDGSNRLSFFRAATGDGTVTVYDGLNEFGPYILANGNRAWTPWNTQVGRESTWIRLDDAGQNDWTPGDFNRQPTVRLSIPALDESAKTWFDIARNAAFYAGVLSSLDDLNDCDATGDRFVAIRSENLGMLLEQCGGENDRGIRLIALVDIPSRTLLTPHTPQSLFTVKVREKKDDSTVVHSLTSDRGWKSAQITGDIVHPEPVEGGCFFLRFEGASALPGAETTRLCLLIRSYREFVPENDPEILWYWKSVLTAQWFHDRPDWPEHFAMESAAFLTIRLASFGNRMKGFYPKASGVVVEKPFGQDFRWNGRYPSGWASMPWFALWNDAEKKSEQTGFYIAAHDRRGTTKELALVADPQDGTVRIEMEYPAENGGQPGAKFAESQIFMESYRGDWFDAATMYRDWVRESASWYPRKMMNSEGRTDTPLWMKELSVWAIGSNPPNEMPDALRKFQQPLGVPVGVHWYNWHKIPFDNDYPHYFPTKEGFKKAVTKIQQGNDDRQDQADSASENSMKTPSRRVMPYINGRIWDRRDRDVEDWKFTGEALPGVTKKEDGTPWFETYGSKESDGSPVELGVMCPASKVWNDKQRELILRLTGPADDLSNDEGNMGVAGVYVDQVAAAAPALCFDPSHGHPLGGGSWWVPSYRKMFRQIRSELPAGAMLTTECNAEPFIDLFDGYLTWHFQYDGQVPAFAAVYGGAIQMFGRHYGDGDDRIIASKMKLAESFVFGEQLGWISPHVVNEPERFEFLKKVVALRYRFRDYFYKGEMGRPPKLSGDMPRITADWRFYGPTIVTTDVVRTGAWQIKDSHRAILLFANFSDREQENPLHVDLKELGFDPTSIRVVRYNADGSEQPLESLPEKIRIGPEDAFILEIR